MKIKYIKFVRPLLRRRFVAVALSTGNIYKVKREGRYAVVVPPCREDEKEALGVVYKAVWEWLNGDEGETLDRGAKLACGKLVTLLEWPLDFTADVQSRLEFVVGCIQSASNIF